MNDKDKKKITFTEAVQALYTGNIEAMNNFTLQNSKERYQPIIRDKTFGEIIQKIENKKLSLGEFQGLMANINEILALLDKGRDNER